MMNKGVLNNRVWIPAGAALATCLSGCSKLDVLDPKGSIGVAEKSLIGTATFTMLIVVVQVILMTLWFAWRYRASNCHATYAPKWAHSTAIEVVIWTVPSIIILCLGC
jgi:cytochrome o ubiquinol oxidase subunit 2